MTKIYMLNTEPLNEPGLFSSKLKSLSVFRQEKAMSFRNKNDRVLSLGAGLLIEHGLKRLGLNEKDMRYGMSEYGKPYFMDYPEIKFSVSHCRDMAVCAFSELSVGCDAEIVRIPDFNVAEKFFSEAEKEYVFDHSDETERARAFFKIWTLKESFVKAVGCGLSMPFKEFSVEPDKLSLTCRHKTKKYYFKEYDFGGYITACCCEEPKFPEAPQFVSV